MSSVDNRVVNMKFDNKQFESGVSDSINSMDKLKKSLDFSSTKKGMDDLQNASSRFSLAGVGNAADGVSNKFLAMATVGITALANITNRAVDAGINIIKSLTLDPVLAGFQEYELKMGSIQTILANTSKDGTTLEQVTAALDELNEYSDKTIYNFGAMTKNIGLFTNAGIGIEDATAIIKGFSNEAAASGTNAEGAAGAAYQLSQALSAGVIRLMDWRSLTNVGMGNANMKASLIDIAKAMGKFTDDTTTADAATKDFNGSLEKQWLTADVMTNYLKIQAGELSEEQQKALGLTSKQIEAFSKQQQIAEDAATKVRTATQLFSTIKESIGSSWSAVFGTLIGDFNEATDLWTNVNNVLGPILTAPTDALANVLKGWADLGGRTALLEGFKNIWEALGNVLRPIKEAFAAIFPSTETAGNGLYKLTTLFRDFTEKLKIGSSGLEGLKSVFSALFRVWKVAIVVFQTLASVLGNIASFGWELFGGLLTIIGDLATAFNEWAKPVEKIEALFNGLSDVAEKVFKPIIYYANLLMWAFRMLAQGDTEAFFALLSYIGKKLSLDFENLKNSLGSLGNTIANALDKVKTFLSGIGGGAFDAISGAIDTVSEKLRGIQDLFDVKPKVDTSQLEFAGGRLSKLYKQTEETTSIWERMASAFTQVKDFFAPAFERLGDILGTVMDKFQETLKELNFQDILAVINTGFFIALYYQFRKFLGSLTGLLDNISGTFGQLTDTLKTMQRDVQANIILKIAIAVGILVASLIALAQLGKDELATGLLAVGALMFMLSRTLKKFEDLDFGENSKIFAASAALVLFSAAIRILAFSVEDLGKMDVNQLIQGMVAVGVLMAGMVGIAKTMAKVPAPMLLQSAAALVLMAGAVVLLSGAVFILGKMDSEETGKGLFVLAALIAGLTAMSFALSAAGPTALAGAAGLVLMAGALFMLTGLVQTLAAMDPDKLMTGLFALVKLLGLVLGMAIVLSVLGPGAATGGAGLLLMAAGLWVMAEVIEKLAKISSGDILKGLATMLAFTGIIAILGVTAIFVGPPLLLLAAALLMVGAAMFLAGTGMMLLAGGLALLGTLGSAGVLLIVSTLEAVAGMIPLFMQQLGLGIRALAVVIAESGPELVAALGTMVGALIQAIRDNIPGLGKMFSELLSEGLRIIREFIPEVLLLGYDIILEFLKGLEEKIPEIVTTAGDIIVAFIEALGDQSERIIRAAFQTILDFIEGLTAAIDEYDDKLTDAGVELGKAIITGMGKALLKGPAELAKAAFNLGKSVVGKIGEAIGWGSPSKVAIEQGESIVWGLSIGLSDSGKALNSADELGNDVVKTLGNTMTRVQDIISSDMSMSPVITPVIDLTQYRKDANQMSTLSSDLKFAAEVSSGQANDLAKSQAPGTSTVNETEKAPTTIQFVQQNTSPAALSTTEIYRQTKNQLSQAERALASI